MSKSNKSALPPSAPARALPEVTIATLPKLAGKGRWRLQSLHARNSHDFYWINRGQGQISISGTTRGYGPNSVLFIPAGSVYSLTPGKTWLGYSACLPDNLPVAVPQQPCLIKATSIFDQGQVTGYFDQIATERTTSEPGSEQVIESYMTLLGVWAERNQIRNDWRERPESQAARRLVSAFLQRLENGFRRSHTVAAYAEALDVTPTHLSRVCKARLGKSALTLIQDRLLFEARVLLADSDQPITAISESLGMASPAYFSRIFRAQAGMAPRQFRQTARLPANPAPAQKQRVLAQK